MILESSSSASSIMLDQRMALPPFAVPGGDNEDDGDEGCERKRCRMNRTINRIRDLIISTSLSHGFESAHLFR